MLDTITIAVNIDGNEVQRTYLMNDGQVPDDMQEYIQDMADTLLDKSEI